MTKSRSKVGDNSVAKEKLEYAIERIEALVEERVGINEQIKEVLEAAHNDGLDKKTIKEMVKLRKLKPEERDEMEMLRDLYRSHLGL